MEEHDRWFRRQVKSAVEEADRPGAVFISPEKTPGSAGGLTEFDSSGNMSLKLASAVQIGCPRHDEYLPKMH